MYENEAQMTKPAYGVAQLGARRIDVTLRQNIEGQIEIKKKELAELEETKSRMEASGILDMRIDDLQRAMRF